MYICELQFMYIYKDMYSPIIYNYVAYYILCIIINKGTKQML